MRRPRIIYGDGVSRRPEYTPMHDKGICHSGARAFDYRYVRPRPINAPRR